MEVLPYLIWILEHILYKIKVSGYAKAYVPGKKLKDNVRFHKNRPMVLTLDLTDFFGSIKKDAVSLLFQFQPIFECFADTLCYLVITMGVWIKCDSIDQ